MAERGPAMSDNGRFVVFASAADDLVANGLDPCRNPAGWNVNAHVGDT